MSKVYQVLFSTPERFVAVDIEGAHNKQHAIALAAQKYTGVILDAHVWVNDRGREFEAGVFFDWQTYEPIEQPKEPKS